MMHVDDLVRVLNYMPCHCGYEFSIDPVWRGRGTTETYEVAGRGRTPGLLLRAALESGLTVETRYALQGERLCVAHAVTNGGDEPAEVSPFTHPEWNYDAFGPQGVLEMRCPDGTWATMLLNPEERRGRDLAFAGEKLPAGCWRMASAVHPIRIEETFEPEPVESARLNLSLYGRNVNLELHLKPRVLQPGERAAFSTTWRFGRP